MKKNIILTAVLMLCAGVLMAQNEVFKSGDLYYEITGENTVRVAASFNLVDYVNYYHADCEYVNIPATVTYNDVTYDVTAIEAGAFAFCQQLKAFDIASSITRIPELTFAFTGLEYARVPEGIIEVGQGAFGACNQLQQVVLPSTLATIDYNIFSQCSALQLVMCMAQTPPTTLLSSELDYVDDFLLIVPQGCMTSYKSTSAWNNFHILEMGAVWIEVSYSDDPSHTLTFFGEQGKQSTIVIAEVGKQVEYIMFNDVRVEREELELTEYPLERLGNVPVCLFTTPVLSGSNVKDDMLAGELGSKKSSIHIVYSTATEVVTNPSAGELLDATSEAIERTGCITVQYPGKEIKAVDYSMISITQGLESGVIVEQENKPGSVRRRATGDVEVYSVACTPMDDQGDDEFAFHPVWYSTYYDEKGVSHTYEVNTLPAGYCYVVTLAEGAVTFADDTKSSLYSWEFKMAIGTDVEDITIAGTLAYNGYEVVASDAGKMILVYDMQGVLVAVGWGRIDVSNLARGIYIARSGSEFIKIAL